MSNHVVMQKSRVPIGRIGIFSIKSQYISTLFANKAPYICRRLHTLTTKLISNRQSSRSSQDDDLPIYIVACQRDEVSKKPPGLKAATRHGARDPLVRSQVDET